MPRGHYTRPVIPADQEQIRFLVGIPRGLLSRLTRACARGAVLPSGAVTHSRPRIIAALIAAWLRRADLDPGAAPWLPASPTEQPPRKRISRRRCSR